MHLTVPVLSLTRLHRRRPANTYDLLKCVAVLTMIIDHIGLYLMPEAMWWRVVGRVAFPLFLFLVGYSGITRTDTRVLIGAVLVSIGEYLVNGTVFPLNILWAIALTRFWLGYFGEKVRWQFLPLLLGWVLAVPLVAYGTSPLVFGILGAAVRQYETKVPRRFIILVCFVLGLHTVSQLVSFDFTWQQSGVVIAIGIGLALTLSRFRIQPLALPRPLVVLSRWSSMCCTLPSSWRLRCGIPLVGRGGERAVYRRSK